ncbi:hypothetical protein G6F37_007234 [Rhizopus arrhizus]|nr:hypothetical protein G6F38_011105 [Rhizopus arrhizus]KAG1156850.1 hypothetical protein G6F37_007234 [Rhizopus arrhizus]
MVTRSQGHFKIMINGAKLSLVSTNSSTPTSSSSATRRESIETISLDEAKDLILPRLLPCDTTSMKDSLDITTSFAHFQAHVFNSLTLTSLLTFETHLQHLIMSNILIVGKNKNHPDLDDFVSSNIKDIRKSFIVNDINCGLLTKLNDVSKILAKLNDDMDPIVIRLLLCVKSMIEALPSDSQKKAALEFQVSTRYLQPLLQALFDSLLSTFSKERKRLICPNCNQQGHFRRHGSTKSDPPHLLFRCDNLFASRNQRRIQRQEAAARFLQPPSDNQGFQYIYVVTKVRVPIGQVRSRLRKLDINNNRILDIHYPDRNILTLLVHNDYAAELRQQLQRFKITIKDDFDPCSPQNLRDPKYANLPVEERTNRAFMHHCDRMERALQFIRVPVKYAVARHFFSKGWISQKKLLDIIPTRHPRHQELVDDLLYSEDDQMSTTNEHDDNHSSSNNANSSQHSIDFDI